MTSVFLLIGMLGLFSSSIGGIISFATGQWQLGIMCCFGIISSCAFITLAELDESNKKTIKTLKGVCGYLSKQEDYINYLVSKEEYDPNTMKKENEFDSLVDYGIYLQQNKKYARCFQAFKHAADEGDIKSYAYLGFCYMKGYCGFVSEEAAIEWYNKASDLGDSLGKYFLALCYFDGKLVKRDNKKGKELMLESAKLGNKKAIKYVRKTELTKDKH